MGKIKVTPCDIKGLYVIEPTVFKDERGYFMETYNQNDFHEAGLDMVFVQDNQSMSVKGVLRGLHYQKQYPQGKLVRAVRGTVFDVAVDLRTGSETYGNGLAWFFPRRTRSSSTFRKDLHTAFWYCPMRQNLHTNVPIFIILVMRAVWHGTIRRLALSGRSRKAWS